MTKNRKLLDRKTDICVYFIKGKNISNKIKEVLEVFGRNVDKNKLMSRCLKCNQTDFYELDRY